MPPPIPSTLGGVIAYLAGCDDPPVAVRLVLERVVRLARVELPRCDAASR